MAVPADAEMPACAEVGLEGEEAVAQVAFGRRAEAGDGTPPCEFARFRRRHVRAVNEAPALVDARVLEQPLDRPTAAPGDTVVYLFRLLGGVNVYRRSGCDLVEAGQQCGEERRAHRTQRVRRDADPHVRVVTVRAAHAPDDLEHVLGLRGEPDLCRLEGRGAESGVCVERGKMRDGDAGLACGADMRERHLGAVRVGASHRVVVKVVELRDCGVTVAQHLHVQLRRDRVAILGCEARQEPVHDFAPCPERVLGRSHPFRETGHCALEGVGVQVRHPRDHRAAGILGVSTRRVRRDRCDRAVRTDLDEDVASPFVGQHRDGCVEAADHGRILAVREGKLRAP